MKQPSKCILLSNITMHLSFMTNYYDHLKPTMTIEAFCKENIIGISLEKISNILSCVGEAITNIKEHAYTEEFPGMVHIICNYRNNNTLVITIIDNGCGIQNLEQAFQSGWSSKEGFSGMGFTIMDSLCDEFEVSTTTPDKGTKVIMTFKVGIND